LANSEKVSKYKEKNLKKMTKNSEYIIPKVRPFETVYELKNEVPSFEEFMKTYEGNVDYSDL
jgi:hypothetical protein